MIPSDTPINQHSLQSLELWLRDLGATKDIHNQSKWHLLLPNWNAIIILISLFLAILIASFTGKEIESIPTWLLG